MRYRDKNFLSGSRIRWIIILWIVLACLVSVASAISWTFSAPNWPTIGPKDAQSPETGTLRIPVTVVNAKDIGAIKMVFVINTEPDFLTFVQCDQGEIAPGSIFDCSYTYMSSVADGTKSYQTVISLATTSGISGSGNLVYLNFKYNPSFTGTKTVLIVYGNGQVFDLKGNQQAFGEFGNVYYIGGAPDKTLTGDVNGDGQVTSKDALMSIQMTTGKIAENLAADMDNNKKVEVNDVLLILQKASQMGAVGAGGGVTSGAVGKIGGVMSLNPSTEAELPAALKANYEVLKASPQLLKASPQLQKASQGSQNQQQAQDKMAEKTDGVKGGVAQGQQQAQDKMAEKTDGIKGGVAQDQQQAQQLAKGQQAAQNQQVAQAGKVG